MEILHKLRRVSEKIREINVKSKKVVSDKQSQRDVLDSRKDFCKIIDNTP